MYRALLLAQLSPGAGWAPFKIHQMASIIDSLTNVAILVTHLHRLRI